MEVSGADTADLESTLTQFARLDIEDHAMSDSGKEEAEKRAPEKSVGDEEKPREGIKFKPFTGVGRRLDGEVVMIRNDDGALESEEEEDLRCCRKKRKLDTPDNGEGFKPFTGRSYRLCDAMYDED